MPGFTFMLSLVTRHSERQRRILYFGSWIRLRGNDLTIFAQHGERTFEKVKPISGFVLRAECGA